ncbi:hypothetical protein EXX14_10690 [Escherichia coli]|uniref:hypothetical protein n=1 Tax=Escherichia coli TaxID=562 RepID=UPI00102D6955|nr:hypothetical protein [Escherichia coli]EJE8109826.1 hypothetical protein [Escherichia coli]RZZ31979.1 hypothetical protein EXX14_10690 [Escherichia coli]
MIGKIIKYISLSFAIALFAVLALSAIDNQMEQKAWNKYKNEHEFFISDTERCDDNYNNQKIWQHTILLQNVNVIIVRNL